MKEFLRLFRRYLKRGIISPTFIICTALSMLLMFFLTAEQINPEQYRNPPGLHYFLSSASDINIVYFMLMLTSLPAATMFYDDWKSGNIKFILPRAGRVRYAFAVTTAAGITSAAVMMLAYIIYSIFILSKFPLVTNLEPNALRASTLGFPNSGLICEGKPILCYILYFISKGAMAAFFSAFSIFQSMLITNKRLTLISPVLIYILYFSFNLFYVLPAVVNPFVMYWNSYKLYLVFGGTQDGRLFSPFAGIYPLIFTVLITVVLSLLETKLLRYKMNRCI